MYYVKLGVMISKKTWKILNLENDLISCTSAQNMDMVTSPDQRWMKTDMNRIIHTSSRSVYMLVMS